MKALTKGIASANLKRKHRLGSEILRIYSLLGDLLRGPDPVDAHLRPYYDEMKRLYLRNLKKRSRRKAKDDEPKTPE